MDIRRDIQTLSEFKQNASKLVKQVQNTRQPLVLTVNGKPAAVLQDVESYQRMIGESDYWETVRVIKERIADIDDRDKWLSHNKVFGQIRKKYKIKSPSK